MFMRRLRRTLPKRFMEKSYNLQQFRFYCVAYRWKSEFNENSKILSYCNVFPELNHNELMGYVNYSKMNIPLHIIMLRYDEDNKRIIKR